MCVQLFFRPFSEKADIFLKSVLGRFSVLAQFFEEKNNKKKTHRELFDNNKRLVSIV